MYACAKYPGRVHDSAVFTASSLYAALCGGALWGPACDGAFRPCLLVDSAYPLLPFTMKRFNTARNRGSACQRAFDRALCRGRNPIERAWGRLIERWKICDGLPAKELRGVPGIIVSCMAVLHNFCEAFDPIAPAGATRRATSTRGVWGWATMKSMTCQPQCCRLVGRSAMR